MSKTIIILGIPIEDLTMSEAVDRCEAFVTDGRETGTPHYVATANADFAVISLYDPDLRRLLLEADMTTPDGMPLVWASRLLGMPIEGRVTGADLLPALSERAAEKGLSVFLLGAGPGVAARTADILRARYPNLNIVGTLSPSPAPLLEMDPSIIEMVRAAKPDILFVALGTPKQEKWIKMHLHELQVPLSIGVGGSFDFIAGVTKRAPVWMQRAGLEWLFRLTHEPRRLWRRYVLDMFYFSVFFVRQWWEMRNSRTTSVALPVSEKRLRDNTAVLAIQGRMDVTNQAEFVNRANQILDQSPYLIINMSEATFLDSSALGTLVALTNRARKAGGELWLVGVPSHITHLFSMMRLEHFLTIRDGDDIPVHQPKPPVVNASTEQTVNQWAVIKMPRVVDTSTTSSVIEQCMQSLSKNPYLILDFSETIFLASAGLAMLIKLNRYAEERDGALRLAHCSRDVVRCIQMVKLDTMFTLFDNIEVAANTELHTQAQVGPVQISLPVSRR